MTEQQGAFDTLFHLDVSERVEKKKAGNTQLSYLSWAWAWAEVKKRYPEAQYEILKFENNQPYVFDEKTGYMVFTKVTIEGITHEMWLPVMDGTNKAMKSEPYDYQVIKWTNKQRDGFTTKSVEAATMFDVNKTIMRCLVKNLAMFGLGLYIYSGEDLPEAEPVKAISNAQATVLTSVIEQIAQLTGQDPMEATSAILNKVGLVSSIEEMTTDQYGEFLNYLNKLKQTYEKKAAEKKEEETVVEPEPETDTEQTAMLDRYGNPQ